MMSKEVYRLHPISAVITSVKVLKNMILPVAIIVITNGFNFSFDFRSPYFIETILLFGIWGSAAVLALITGIVKWRTFVYWFENGELHIRYGLFVKKKRYISFERIQSLNYHEGIFHRLFGLVKVQVETAGSKNGKPEAELTAIPKSQANSIELEMQRAKIQDNNLGEFESSGTSSQKTMAPVIYQMSMRDLIVLATTSGGIGVVLSGLLAVVSQFSDIIPYEKLFDELEHIVKVGIFLMALTVMLGFMLAWIFSVVITIVNYYEYTVRIEAEKLVITKGLLEKKRITLPLNRIQGVQIVENPLRQLTGFSTVFVESAGANGENSADKKIALFPLIRRKECFSVLAGLFPEVKWETEFIRSPKRARALFYRIDFIWLLPTIAICTYFFYPYGLLSLLLIPIIMLIDVWQYKTAGYSLVDKQLIMQYRFISRFTFFMEKKRIQSLQSSQTYFQKRKQVMSVKATVMSGMTGTTGHVPNLEKKDVEKIFAWYEHENKN